MAIQSLTVPITITEDNSQSIGKGLSTVYELGATMPVNMGMIDITASGVTVANMVFDGQTVTPTGVLRSTITAPEQGSFVLNTTMWVHGGVKNLVIDTCTFQHSASYCIFLDARAGDIENVVIQNCNFVNNRPFLFGSTSGALNFGSWIGPIFIKNLGNGTNNYAVKNLIVQNCTFSRNTGNNLWCHSNGFQAVNTNITIQACQFENAGLDAIEIGNTNGATITGCNFHRIGYIALDDTSDPLPGYDTGAGAVAIDTTSNVSNASYTGNTMTSLTGAGFDLDGMYNSTITGNTVIQPDSSDPLYSADHIATCGALGGANAAYGIQTGNTYQALGGQNVTITNNTFYNMGTRAISLQNARNCKISDNTIWHSGSALEQPIIIFPVDKSSTNGGTTGAMSQNSAWGNKIEGNRITYGADTAASAYCIAEINIGTSWASGDVNKVWGNECTGTNYGQFQKDPSSGSYSAAEFPTNDAASTSPDVTQIQREGTGTSAVLKTYKIVSGTKTQISQLSDASFLNLSVAGAANTGALATGNRSLLAWPDCIATSKLFADGFLTVAATTYAGADANILDSSYGLLKYVPDATNPTTSPGTFYVSNSVSAGVRQWTALGSGGSGGSGAAGSDTQIQYAKGGTPAFGADANFTWNYTSQVMTVTGVTATSALNVLTGYLYTTGGIVSDVNSWQAINTNTDGALLRGYALAETSSNTGGYFDFSPLTYATFPAPLNGLGSFGSTDPLLWACGANGTTTPVTSIGLMTNAYINAAAGFVTPSTATNAMQVPNGGLTAKYLIGTTSLTVEGDSAVHAGLSGAGEGRIYFDSSTNQFLVSQNGGAYATLSTGGGTPPAGSNTQIQFNNSSVFGASSNLTWNNSSQILTVTAASSSVYGLYNAVGYVLSDNGFSTGSSATSAINALSGGVTAKWLIADDSVFWIEESAPALSGSSQARVYADSTSHTLKLSQNGGAYANILTGSSVVNSVIAGTGISVSSASGNVTITATGGGATSPAGSSTDVQYNSSGSFAGSSNFTWNNSSQILTVTAASTSVYGLYNATGYILSDGGFSTGSTSTSAINALNGGVDAKWLIASDSVFWIEESVPSVSGAGQARIYADSSSHTLKLSQNGGAYANILTGASVVNSLTAGTGISLSGSSGAVTVTNSGVTALTAGSGISLSGSTGSVTISSTASGVAGSNTDVQFNNSGAFGASSNFVWDNTNKILEVIGTSSGVHCIYASVGYILSDGGFNTGATAYNAIQGGGFYCSGTVVGITNDGPYFSKSTTSTPSESTTTYGGLLHRSGSVWNYWNPATTSWSTVDFSVVGGGVSSLSAGTGISLSGSTGAITVTNSGVTSLGGSTGALNLLAGTGVSVSGLTITNTGVTSLTAGSGISLSGSTGGITISSTAGSVAGSNGDIQFNSSGSFGASANITWDNTNKILEVFGTSSAVHCIYANTGYVLSDGGFITGSTAYNAIQAYSGGFYCGGAGVGITNEGPYFSLSTTSLPSETTTTFGGLLHRSGSVWNYWNPAVTSWGTVDLSLVGVSAVVAGAGISVASGGSGSFTIANLGVRSLGGLTGALNLVGSTGISVSGTTITNIGVTSLGGFTGSVNLSAGTGVSVSGTTISIGQNVSTSSSVTFGSLSIGSTLCISSGGIFEGNGVGCPLYGVQCAGVNPYISGTQYYGVTSSSFQDLSGATHLVRGGIIVS